MLYREKTRRQAHERQRRGATPAQLALACYRRRLEVTNVILGASRLDSRRENPGASNVKLLPVMLETVDKLYPPVMDIPVLQQIQKAGFAYEHI